MTILKSVIIINLLTICVACSNKTELKSYAINEKAERIRILANEVKMFSEIEDAEFDLYNVNGFSGEIANLPGTSSIYYRFVIKVNPSDVEKWKQGFVETPRQKEVEKWNFDLIKVRAIQWKTTSEPKFYSRKDEIGVKLVIFANDGIIFKKIDQQ